jgi:subtilisin family serine protease
MDDNGHGTHVAGTIAAETNNGVGVAGVMWQAQILPLKVLNSRGSGSSGDVASAIRYAADQGADVINMSLGSSSCSQTIADAVNYAYFDKGVVIVAAAGNNGGSIGYPAKHPPVIAVGATDHNDHKAYFSSFGDDLDVVAPGVTVFSTVPNNGYDAFSGTSMASPHVAGVAGLLLAQRPDLSNGQVREILRQSTDDLGQSGFDRYYGYGRVNAYQSLQMETPDEPPAPERAKCGCAAGAALADEPDGQSMLSTLRAVRDEVFTQDPGRRWTRIYYEHQFEVAWLLMSDGQLRADARAGFCAFDPVFRAGLGDDEADPPVILTPELIEAARRALMGVAEHGSSALHDDIVREWEKVDPYRFVGWDVLEVWEQLRFEEQSVRIYLPIVLK